MNILKDKVALITGGAGGQGTEEAVLFAAQGAKVVIADLADEKGEALAQRIRDTGGQALYVHLDVSSEKEWAETVGRIKDCFGGMHILVNNAGVNGPGVLPYIKIEDWERLLRIDLTGCLIGIQACAELMRDSGGGSIVNIGSTAGMEGHWLGAYSAAKWALRALTRTAAYNLARWNIRCNIVCPGLVETPLSMNVMPPEVISQFKAATALGRGCRPEEIAKAVLFLASDESSYITGIDLPVDGGMSGCGVYGQIERAADMLGKTF